MASPSRWSSYRTEDFPYAVLSVTERTAPYFDAMAKDPRCYCLRCSENAPTMSRECRLILRSVQPKARASGRFVRQGESARRTERRAAPADCWRAVAEGFARSNRSFARTARVGLAGMDEPLRPWPAC